MRELSLLNRLQNDFGSKKGTVINEDLQDLDISHGYSPAAKIVPNSSSTSSPAIDDTRPEQSFGEVVELNK